jgi:guanylate kinase
MAKLILLSGPSCIGKGPLTAALSRFYPDLTRTWRKLVLYNSRSPRPGEKDGVDYHFRKREAIDRLGQDEQFLLAEVRGDLQAIDLRQLFEQLQDTDIFFEGNPYIVEKLLKHPQLQDVKWISVFLSPLSREEIEFLKKQSERVDLQEFVTEMMRRKLLRRTAKQKTNLSLKDLEDIERRAGSALKEMRFAPTFDSIIANHDGEDSDHWDAFYFPIGDARTTLLCFAGLLQGHSHAAAQQWPANLFDD